MLERTAHNASHSTFAFNQFLRILDILCWRVGIPNPDCSRCSEYDRGLAPHLVQWAADYVEGALRLPEYTREQAFRKLRHVKTPQLSSTQLRHKFRAAGDYFPWGRLAVPPPPPDPRREHSSSASECDDDNDNALPEEGGEEWPGQEGYEPDFRPDKHTQQLAQHVVGGLWP